MADIETRSMDWATIEATSAFESEEEALETLVQLKDIELGDLFTNRDTRFNSEEREGISITFFHDESPTTLLFNIGDGAELKIRFTVIEEEAHLSTGLFNTILAKTGPITIEEVVISKNFEHPFHSLDLPIKDDSDLDVIGLRLERSDGDYIVQESEADNIVVIFRNDDKTKYDSGFPDDFITADIDRISEFIEEGL